MLVSSAFASSIYKRAAVLLFPLTEYRCRMSRRGLGVNTSLCSCLLTLVSCWSTAGGPAKENISHIGLLPGIRRSLFVDSKAEGGEEIPGLISRRRRTADRHVISKAVRSRVTACCDVGHEVSPEAYHMVLEITVAAVFE